MEEERKAYRLQVEESTKQIQILQGIQPFKMYEKDVGDEIVEVKVLVFNRIVILSRILNTED